jgi:hypothetical protein
MRKFKLTFLSLLAAMALLFLTGCEQLEQAKNGTIENAKQTAIKALEEVTSSGSIEQTKESANQVLIDAKKATAGLLDQAVKYFEQDETSGQKPEAIPKAEPTSAI